MEAGFQPMQSPSKEAEHVRVERVETNAAAINHFAKNQHQVNQSGKKE